MFLAQIGPEASKQFGLSQESCGRALEDDNADIVRRQVDRMLMCCNQVMMTRHQAAVAAPEVAAVESTEPVVERTSVKRSAEDIEPTADDAATKLRNALRGLI